jgi:hypothetical protein
MRKTILPKDLNKFTNMLDNFWGEHDLSNMEIIFNVDKETLKEINMELYYGTEHNGEPEDTDEIIINLNNYKIIYRLEE